jgi:hypothetical protein
MFTHIIQLLQKNRKRKIIFVVLCFTLLSFYPIYKNFYNGAAVSTYERHIAIIEGRSEYFNPWQYRILCPFIIEGMMWVYNNTIDKVYPIEKNFQFHFEQTSEPTPETKKFIELLQTKGAIKYMVIFLLFRFSLNFLVFTFAFCLWRYFVSNTWLIFAGLMFLSLAMGNAVIASDLTFNTYLDNVFYLITACLIVYNKNPLWIIPITVLAAFNRETALLIPFMLLISNMNFSSFNIVRFNIKSIRFPRLSIWIITGVCYLLFISIFIGVRLYYGYVPAQVWKAAPGIQMIKLNLFSTVAVKSFFELSGVFSVIPLIIFYKWRSIPILLRTWFLLIIPIWLSVHIYSVVIYQTRLFLVPLIIIMVPILLYIIEDWQRQKFYAQT